MIGISRFAAAVHIATVLMNDVGNVAGLLAGASTMNLGGGRWLSDMDSNHDNSLQRAMCYHYTIGQTAIKLDFLRDRRKIKRFVVLNGRPDRA